MTASRQRNLRNALAGGAVAVAALGVVACGGADAAPVQDRAAAAPISQAAKMTPADRARGPVTFIPDCVGDPLNKPATYTLACGDSNYSLVRLRWTGWGAKKATATGTAMVNTCTPSCAEGTFQRYPVRVTLDRLRNGEASATYGRMVVRAIGTPAEGIPAVDVYRLPAGAGPVSVR